MSNQVLKFGKFKGMEFSSTPVWYQEWLKKQDWFNKPEKSNALQNAEKQLSVAAKQLKGWNGYSRAGAAAYDRMFDAEMHYENLIYCDCGNRKNPDDKDCGCGGVWSI